MILNLNFENSVKYFFLVGALIFALFLSQIISLVEQVRISGTKFKRHIREVDDYLRFQRCSRNLKSAVKEYYDFHYRQRVFDEELIFSELNPILLEEVKLKFYILDCRSSN